jgi:hypothetical protein
MIDMYTLQTSHQQFHCPILLLSHQQMPLGIQQTRPRLTYDSSFPLIHGHQNKLSGIQSQQ